MRARALLACALLAGATVHVASRGDAQAQPFAQALGHPLPAKDTPPGTVIVRLIAGGIGKPVIGSEVTLVVNGTARNARTDDGGRATFADLPIGATVQAKVIGEDKQELASDSFQIDGGMGTRVMLSTRPIDGGGGAAMGGGGGGGAPAMGGGAGGPMIEPRQASGQPRFDPSYDKGTITVVAVYDDFKDPAVGIPVALVGYRSDDTITMRVNPTTTDGRAEFRDLDITGNTEYFALAQLPRNGALDRGYARPLELDGRGGVHLILSGAKRDATTAPVDDLAVVQRQDDAPAAGKVRVAINGPVAFPAPVTLVDAQSGQVVATAQAARQAADPNVKFESQFEAHQELEKGLVGVVVHGGAQSADQPLKGITAELLTDDGAPAGTAPVTATTDDSGQAALQGVADPKLHYKVAVTVNGVRYTSERFEVGTSGGVVEVVSHWDNRGKVFADFDLPSIPGRVLYAEATNQSFRYRSAPFQTIPTAGTVLQMYFYPRTLMTFRIGGSVEDQQLGVQGTFTVSNYSWAPFAGGADGTVVPLPRGFKGAVVAEGDQETVAVAQGEGFRFVRPIPPGGRQFHGGFSLPIDGGSLEWSMDLPYGALESSIKLLKTPEMTVDAKTRVSSDDVPGFGPVYVIEPIRIMPGQSMQMTIRGLPSAPSWRLWVPRVLGIVVIFVLIAGVVFAIVRPPAKPGQPGHDAAVRASRAAKREALLAELVELEREARAGDDADAKAVEQRKRRKETLITQLEVLWGSPGDD